MKNDVPTSTDRFAEIAKSISPYRRRLAEHPVYSTLSSVADVQTFMEHHVFAVWDFMSLAKSLQNSFTCTSVPWVPPSNPTVARFINEIIFEEESDLDQYGEPMSHFQMYLLSMKEVGAKTEAIDHFIHQLKNGTEVMQAIGNCRLPESIQRFIRFTFSVIEEAAPHKVAAAFTYGREDLIPDMFLEILKQADPQEKQFARLRFYLNRHIELDGDDHGPLALKMVENLCGNDDRKWQEVQETAVKALEARIALWDGIEDALR